MDDDNYLGEYLEELSRYLRRASAGPVSEVTLSLWGTNTACTSEQKLTWYSHKGSLPPSVGELEYDCIEGAFELVSAIRNPDQDQGDYQAYTMTYQVYALLNEQELEELHMEEHWEAQGDRSRDQVDALVGCSMAELGAALYPVGGEL